MRSRRGSSGLFVTPDISDNEAPASTPSLAPAPTPAPSTAMASTNSVIDLDEEDYIFLRVPDENVVAILPSDLLDYIKERGIEILRTASKNCLSDKLEDTLKDRTDNVQNSKTAASMIALYERTCAKELRQARKILDGEIEHVKKLDDQLQREDDQEIFRQHIVEPKKTLLAEADQNIRVFANLIGFLKVQAGI